MYIALINVKFDLQQSTQKGGVWSLHEVLISCFYTINKPKQNWGFDSQGRDYLDTTKRRKEGYIWSITKTQTIRKQVPKMHVHYSA